MVNALERILNLRPGEFRRGILLFLYLFLVLTSFVVGKAARDAMFLDRFQAVQLPYADFTVALIVGLVVAPYIRLGRHVSLRTLLVGSLLFFVPPFHMYRHLKGSYSLGRWGALWRTSLLVGFAFAAVGLFTALIVGVGEI